LVRGLHYSYKRFVTGQGTKTPPFATKKKMWQKEKSCKIIEESTEEKKSIPCQHTIKQTRKKTLFVKSV